MIHLKNVTKNIYNYTILDDISLSIPTGGIVGILSPSASGKTTLLKLIAGLISPDKGSISIDADKWPQIGYKPQQLAFPSRLRLKGYLSLLGQVSNFGRAEAAQVTTYTLEWARLSGLGKKFLGRETSFYSRQRIGLAQAIVGGPPIILLDQPTEGVTAFEEKQDIWQQIRALQHPDRIVVVASADLEEIVEVCTDIIVMSQSGRVHYKNRVENAMSEKPYIVIRVASEGWEALHRDIRALHEQVRIEEDRIVLRDEAIAYRRAILAIILHAGHDIADVSQQRLTLSDIYAEVTP